MSPAALLLLLLVFGQSAAGARRKRFAAFRKGSTFFVSIFRPLFRARLIPPGLAG